MTRLATSWAAGSRMGYLRADRVVGCQGLFIFPWKRVCGAGDCCTLCEKKGGGGEGWEEGSEGAIYFYSDVQDGLCECCLRYCVPNHFQRTASVCVKGVYQGTCTAGDASRRSFSRGKPGIDNILGTELERPPQSKDNPTN